MTFNHSSIRNSPGIGQFLNIVIRHRAVSTDNSVKYKCVENLEKNSSEHISSAFSRKQYNQFEGWKLS